MHNLGFIWRVLKERGLLFFYVYFKESLLFDLRYRTQTSSRVPKSEQKIRGTASEASNGLLYVASFTSVVETTLSVTKEAIGVDKFASSQFVDLGCGKGKTLLVYHQRYADLSIHTAVGIEYDPALADIARSNCKAICAGADSIEIKTDSATNVGAYITSSQLVVYLYNSFQGETLCNVLKLLQMTPHILIYVDPVERAVLPQFGYEIIAENPGRYNADTWLVAKSKIY